MIITKASQLDEVRLFIASNFRLAYDVESTGLNTRKEKVIGFALSNGVQSYYICHLTWDGDKLAEMVSYSECQALLRLLECKQIETWNASFDMRITNGYFKVNLLAALYSDGMLAFHTTQEEGVPFSHRPFGLKSVAAYIYGQDVVAEQADMKASIKANGGTPTEFYKADLEPMARYCMQDAALTYRLNEKFLAQIESEGLSEFYHELEVMPLYREVLIPMEMLGLPVDVSGLLDAVEIVSADLLALEQEIQTTIKPLLPEFEEWFLNKDYPPKRTGPFAQVVAAQWAPELPKTPAGAYSLSEAALNELNTPDGIVFRHWIQGDLNLANNHIKEVQLKLHGTAPMFNLLSKHHLKKLFFEKLGETPLSKTDLGAPQVDETFLESVASKYDWVPKLIEFNKLTKIKSAYMERLLDEHEDGIWYPSFSLHRTISGRLGSDAQQFPRPLEPGQASDLVIKHNNKIRHFFKAQAGYCFIGADQESLEPKCFAHASTDEKLKDIFRKGHDFYGTIAIAVENLKQYSADKSAPNYIGKLDKVARQNAKPYSLGFPYGYSAYKLHKEMNISKEEADTKYNNYFNEYNELWNWMQDTHAECYTKGFVTIETGRKRRFPRAVSIYQRYGEAILNDLTLWKKYHEEPGIYADAKKARREFKNYINNSVNVKIQGLAASLINRACIEITRRFKAQKLETYICLQVHDEIVSYGPIAESELASKTMQDVMENHYTISVPLKAEPQIGLTYGQTK